MKDVQIKLTKEECVIGTGQRSNYAAAKDAQIKPKKEECALDMGLRSHANDAAAKDAQIWFKKEECAWGMERRLNYAAAKDARIKPKKEEFVWGTGPIAYEYSYAAVRQVVLPGDEIIYLKNYPLSLSHNIIIWEFDAYYTYWYQVSLVLGVQGLSGTKRTPLIAAKNGIFKSCGIVWRTLK